ncbi:12239_t:CDS:1, partial [Racocetra persica]
LKTLTSANLKITRASMGPALGRPKDLNTGKPKDYLCPNAGFMAQPKDLNNKNLKDS